MLKRNYYDENLMHISYSGGNEHRDDRYCNVIGHNSMPNVYIFYIMCALCSMCEQRTYTNGNGVYYKLCNAYFYRLLKDLFKSETFDSLYNTLLYNVSIFIKYQPTVKSQLVFLTQR